MNILKVKILLCFLNMRESDLNVTNLAVTLGEEKYAISRAFTALEKGEDLLQEVYGIPLPIHRLDGKKFVSTV